MHFLHPSPCHLRFGCLIMEEHDDNVGATHPCNNESGSLPIHWIPVHSQFTGQSECHMCENDDSIADQACEHISGNGSCSRMDILDPPRDACLTMQLCEFPFSDLAKEGDLQEALPCGSNGAGDNEKHSGLSLIRQPRKLLKSSQNQQSIYLEGGKDSSSRHPFRVARPPGEGKGKNQLLPRYWPRITDQELRQIRFANSNSSFTPLFEKILSASDAGRIGRLVLPKACAEAYFPSISQPEGVPLNIQDVSGKDWVFQFRFWPNNNSRMYVLEGVTPCIQSMNLQAGDTVTFMRIEPEGKLVMGYRRAPNLSNFQDSQPEMVPAEAATSRGSEVPNIADVSRKGSIGTSINGQGNLSETGNEWYETEKSCQKSKESLHLHSLSAVERKKGHYLGSKSKRLSLEVEESLKLKLSWEEAQELLRPPPNHAPSILTIEGHEFEEYEEPPVFGKRTIFTSRRNGLGEAQWAQCDNCRCWRRVPSDVFLPTRWVCDDNVWDPQRTTCNASRESESNVIDSILQQLKGSGETVVEEETKVKETPGLDALATAATLGENNIVSSSPAATTKHPRHRPGCTCIVCIQPPSGKGPKHKPTCVCNVCMTVRRRFKTLMMRRKKRQSEREAENARKKWTCVKEERVNCEIKWQPDNYSLSENGTTRESLAMSFPGALPKTNTLPSYSNDCSMNASLSRSFSSISGSAKDEYLIGNGQIDLNCQPERHDEPGSGSSRMSMVRLLQSATYPLDIYLKQQGLTSLICYPRVNPSVGIAQTATSKRIEELHGSRSAVSNPERPQEETYLTLGPENGTAITYIESFDIMERNLSFLSTQNS